MGSSYKDIASLTMFMLKDLMTIYIHFLVSPQKLSMTERPIRPHLAEE